MINRRQVTVDLSGELIKDTEAEMRVLMARQQEKIVISEQWRVASDECRNKRK